MLLVVLLFSSEVLQLQPQARHGQSSPHILSSCSRPWHGCRVGRGTHRGYNPVTTHWSDLEGSASLGHPLTVSSPTRLSLEGELPEPTSPLFLPRDTQGMGKVKIKH